MLKRTFFVILSLLMLLTIYAPLISAAEDHSGESSPSSDVILSGDDAVVSNDIRTDTYYRARVLKVLLDDISTIEGNGYTLESHVQTLLVEIKSGEYKGKEAKVTFDMSDNWSGNNEPDPAKPGDLLIVNIEPSTDGVLFGYVAQFGRQDKIIGMGIIFLALVVFFGGKKGLRSIIALVCTCVCMICILMPLLLGGFSPVLGACLAGVVSIALTLIIVYGFKTESYSAALGAFGGVAAAGILVLIMNSAMNMTGFVDEESMYLAQSVQGIDLRGLLFAAILISVLGGTMDVAISISSALKELKDKASSDITGAELMASGVKIGVDIMGASLNTLILAYVGGSIHLLMLFYTYDIPFIMIINDEMIAAELLRAFVGCLGLLLTVPISSFVSGMLMCKGNFGKLSPDCFASVAFILRACGSIKSGYTKVRERFIELNEPRRAKKAAEDAAQGVPENLYEKAVEKSAKHDDEYFADDK